jgi:hypothetical protein
MKRVLTLWLALLAVFWAVRTAISVLLFGRVDQGYEAALQLVAVPALQAAALGWATRRPGGAPLALPWRVAWARQRLVLVLIAELVVLGLGWLAALGWLAPLAPGGRAPRWLALGAGTALPAWSAAAQLAAAAVLCARAVRRQPALATRALVALLAAGLLAAACQPLTGWLGGLTRLLGSIGSPFLLAAGLAAAGGALLLAAAAALRPSSPAAARALDWTLGLAWLGLAAFLLGPGLRPAAPEPFASIAGTCGGLAASAALVAAYLAAFPESPAGGPAGAWTGRRRPARRVPMDRQTAG